MSSILFGFGATKVVSHDFEISSSCALRSHRLITLANGLECLLVSDPSQNCSAVALSVGAGSYCDPESALGLAHLCEHMLFMGTTQFPNPATYVRGVIENGGLLNAFTTGENTTFKFQVPHVQDSGEPIFNKLLGNFSSFFMQPKFDISYLKRELNTIENEHQLNANNTDKVLYHGLRLLAKKSAPFARFTTGNLHTLDAKPLALKGMLVEYFEKNYCAKNMKLVISSSLSLNLLQRLAILNFSGIKENGSKKIKRKITEHDYFESGSHNSARSSTIKTSACMEVGKVLHIKSDMALPRMRLVFPIENTSLKLKSYQRIWCNLLGDESEGSILRHLEKLNLARAVYVYSLHPCKETDLLIVEIQLTKSGHRKLCLRKVVAFVFEYISEIIHCNHDYIRNYIHELVCIDKLNFYFKDVELDPLDEVAEYAVNLNLVDEIGPEMVFKGFKWELPSTEDFILATKMLLSTENMDMILLSPRESNGVGDCCGSWSLDPYFEFEYNIQPFDDAFVSFIQSPFQEHDRMLIPLPNPFLMYSSAEIHQLSEQVKKYSSADPTFKYVTKDVSSKIHPDLIEIDNNHEIWYKPDPHQSFGMISLDYKCNSLPQDVKSTIAIEVFCNMVSPHINGKLYCSELIGFTWEIYQNTNTRNSISITVTGLTKGLDLVLTTIVETMELYSLNAIKCTYEEFKKSRVEVRSKYDSLANNSLEIEQIVAGTQHILENNVWGIKERICSLEELEIGDIIDVSSQILRPDISYISILQQGGLPNFQNWYRKLGSHLVANPNPNKSNNFFDYMPSSYAIARNLAYLISSTSANSKNNTICMYMQVGSRDSLLDRCLSKLLSIKLAAVAPLELRIKRNLGYNVFTGQRINLTTIGIYIMISSSQYNCQYLVKETNKFIIDWMQDLKRDAKNYNMNIIKPFSDNCQTTDVSGVGLANLNVGLLSEIGSNSKPTGDRYLQHKNFWVSIVDRTYRFGSTRGEEEVDVELMKRMQPRDFTLSIERILGLESRSSVTLMLHSKSTKSQSTQKKARINLEPNGSLEMYNKQDLESTDTDRSPGAMQPFSQKRAPTAVKKPKGAIAQFFSSRSKKSHAKKEPGVLTTVENFHRLCSTSTI